MTRTTLAPPRAAPLSRALVLVVATATAACGDDIAVTSTSGGDASASEGSSSTGSLSTTGGSEGSSISDTSGSESASAGTSSTTSTGGETTSSGSSTTGATGSSSSSGSSGSSGTSSTTGDTGGVDIACVDDNLPYAGPLCGPPGQPCTLSADEAVEAAHHFRNEAPAIAFNAACDPEVAFSIAEGGYFGYFARRVGVDSWSTEATPFPLARVALAHEPAGDAPLALAYDGAFGTSLWRREAGQWKSIAPLPGKNIASARGFARAPMGPLHAAVVADDGAVRHAIHDGAWQSTAIGGDAPASAAVALDPAGDPHLTFWSSKNLTWELYYAAPPEPPELVFPLGSNVLELQQHGIAVVPGDGNPLDAAPYVLAARQLAGGLHELVLAHRISQQKWIVEVVIAEDDKDAKLCDGEPEGPGDTCDYDYVRYRPLAVVASAGGDVRFFYLQHHHVGTLVAQCQMMPMPVCAWAPQSDTSTAELRIGWPTDQGPKWAALAEDVFITDATATVDAAGRIHIAAYESENQDGLMVRYLRAE